MFMNVSAVSKSLLRHAFATTLFLSQVLICLDKSSGQSTDESEQFVFVQAQHVIDSLEALGNPLPQANLQAIRAGIQSRDRQSVENRLEEAATCVVTINPESRVKVAAGQTAPRLQQAGYVPWLIKVVNQGSIQAALKITSPQAGPAYSGEALLSMQRQDQLHLRTKESLEADSDRFLHIEPYVQAPMRATLSGMPSEYVIVLMYSSVSGPREATLEFSVGSGTQDLGFRAQLPIATKIPSALPVRLSIHDEAGQSAFARITVRDTQGRVFPPQPRRLAPDFFFQQQVYREDGESLTLPPGEFLVESSQGPETIPSVEKLTVSSDSDNHWKFTIRRWVRPLSYGWACGDHHIHGAGCAHYTSPTQGVTPADMFRQVAGEGLNVGCILTWGPCFEYQRNFFRPDIDALSRPQTLLKYDLEISGFGSQALGHVCLLNLRDQNYPGSEGTKEKGWPTWATPALRWAKSQGAITGYAHSASGLQIEPDRAAERLMSQLDTDKSGLVSKLESVNALLPYGFSEIDSDRDNGLSKTELHAAIERAADQLPNLAVPEMNSVGAMELPVSVSAGVCDFISSMDTARIPEWNMWYHILNCGFPLKVSGETDFPCMSGNAVGQGRVYVSVKNIERLDFQDWCEGLAAGRSYVSDGYAHALDWSVSNKQSPDQPSAQRGGELNLAAPSKVSVRAKIALAAEMPYGVAYATRIPEGGRRFIGDTVTLHGPRQDRRVKTEARELELVVNGQVVASKAIPADGSAHDVVFEVDIQKSSWLALRIFPNLHTNPTTVIVDGKPVRASADSAKWCQEVIRQLWRQRERNISVTERPAAKEAFDAAIKDFESRAQ